MKSATVVNINKETAKQEKEQWTKGKEGAQHHRKITKPAYVKTGKKMYNEMSREEMAILVRLRTGHCGLNHYLNKRQIVEDPNCECGKGIETVKHYLLDCQRYKTQRQILQAKVGRRNMREERLLGDKRWANYTTQYVKETKRFDEQ